MPRFYRSFTLRLLLGLLAALLAGAPWPSAVHAQTTDPTATDYVTYTSPDESFRIDIPTQWQTLKLSTTTLNLGLQTMEAANPKLKAFFNSPSFRQLMANGMKLYAIDLSEQGLNYILPANVNVLQLDTGVDLALATLKRMNERQLSTLADPDYPLTSDIVHSQNGDALFFHYVVNYNFGGDQSQLTQITQLLLLAQGTQYIVTIGVPLAAGTDYAETIDHILQSFRLVASTPVEPLSTPRFRALTPTAAPTPLATVRNSSLNLRGKPGTGAAIIGHVNQDDTLKVLGQVANCAWLQVQTPQQQVGWVVGAPQFVTLNAACSTIPFKNIPIIPGNDTRQGQGCIRFENNLNAKLTITFTSADGKKNETFYVDRKAKLQHCFVPGVYTYTIDAPPPWGGLSGKIDITPGLNLSYPVNPGS